MLRGVADRPTTRDARRSAAIEAAEARAAAAARRLRQLRAQDRAERRKADTRRKLLTGVAVEAAMAAEYQPVVAFAIQPEDGGKLKAMSLDDILNRYLTRPSDREFMGLKPQPP